MFRPLEAETCRLVIKISYLNCNSIKCLEINVSYLIYNFNKYCCVWRTYPLIYILISTHNGDESPKHYMVFVCPDITIRPTIKTEAFVMWRPTCTMQHVNQVLSLPYSQFEGYRTQILFLWAGEDATSLTLPLCPGTFRLRFASKQQTQQAYGTCETIQNTSNFTLYRLPSV